MKTPDVSVQENIRRKSEVVLDEGAIKGSWYDVIPRGQKYRSV